MIHLKTLAHNHLQKWKKGFCDIPAFLWVISFLWIHPVDEFMEFNTKMAFVLSHEYALRSEKNQALLKKINN